MIYDNNDNNNGKSNSNSNNNNNDNISLSCGLKSFLYFFYPETWGGNDPIWHCVFFQNGECEPTI